MSCLAGSQCAGAGECLSMDGQACTTSADCAGGTCALYYLDADGDGYYGDSKRVCGASPPTGWTANATGPDCCDADANAKPGQTAYFGTANKCGDFNYDCVNGEEREFAGIAGSCTCTSPCQCGCCPTTTIGGFKATVACGALGDWIVGWNLAYVSCGISGGTGYACETPQTEQRTQHCR